MNVLGCLDRPTSGSYRLDGETVSEMSPDALAAVRNRKIGFVFQQFNLLERLDALGNVELAMIYAAEDRRRRRDKAAAALTRVGLAERLHHRPTQLSGGQQQRVAIARALVNTPRLLLADEPTGALDSRTSLELMALFQELNREGTTVVIVTHEPDVARVCVAPRAFPRRPRAERQAAVPGQRCRRTCRKPGRDHARRRGGGGMRFARCRHFRPRRAAAAQAA